MVQTPHKLAPSTKISKSIKFKHHPKAPINPHHKRIAKALKTQAKPTIRFNLNSDLNKNLSNYHDFELQIQLA
jgi:hypothetical protein